MNNNIRIAKELVRIARMLTAANDNEAFKKDIEKWCGDNGIKCKVNEPKNEDEETIVELSGEGVDDVMIGMHVEDGKTGYAVYEGSKPNASKESEKLEDITKFIEEKYLG